MNKRNFHKAILCLVVSALSLISHPLFAQMKIGDNARFLNPDAVLEMESANKGLLLPRLSLRSTASAFPLRTFTPGMMVYNTANTNNVSPGIYVSDGSKWIKANEPAVLPDNPSVQPVFWSLQGNPLVNSNQFLGSTNAVPVILKTNNTERLRISENGWVGIGTPSPKAALHVKGQMVIDSMGSGNPLTDKWLVANPVDGRVKLLSNTPFMTGSQMTSQTVSTNGQSVFQTPATITDPNKIFLFRNGVLISFAIYNTTSITSELPCVAGDQIKIVQLL